MNGWEKMFANWHIRYYDELFMFVCELTAIIFGLIYQRKNRIGQFFIFYIILDISILIFDNYLHDFSGLTGKEFNNSLLISNSLSFLGEIAAYFFFFQLTLRNKLIKHSISVLRIVFIILVLAHLLNVFVIHRPLTGNDMYYLGAVELLFLIIPCLFYFIELFSKPSVKGLFQRPSFWITTGVFFYSFISIPMYSIIDYLLKSKYQYYNEVTWLLFSFPFGISFLFLSKAFTLKTELTT
jgi:hypothetical protein